MNAAQRRAVERKVAESIEAVRAAREVAEARADKAEAALARAGQALAAVSMERESLRGELVEARSRRDALGSYSRVVLGDLEREMQNTRTVREARDRAERSCTELRDMLAAAEARVRQLAAEDHDAAKLRRRLQERSEDLAKARARIHELEAELRAERAAATVHLVARQDGAA